MAVSVQMVPTTVQPNSIVTINVTGLPAGNWISGYFLITDGFIPIPNSDNGILHTADTSGNVSWTWQILAETPAGTYKARFIDQNDENFTIFMTVQTTSAPTTPLAKITSVNMVQTTVSGTPQLGVTMQVANQGAAGNIKARARDSNAGGAILFVQDGFQSDNGTSGSIVDYTFTVPLGNYAPGGHTIYFEAGYVDQSTGIYYKQDSTSLSFNVDSGGNVPPPTTNTIPKAVIIGGTIITALLLFGKGKKR